MIHSAQKLIIEKLAKSFGVSAHDDRPKVLATFATFMLKP